MFQQFKKDILLHKTGMLTLLLIQLGAFVFGVGFVAIIMATDDDPGSWFCMGTLMAAIILIAIALFTSAFGYPQEFRIALSMGCTRKTFMGSYYLRQVLQLIIGWLLVVGLHQIELTTYPLLYIKYQNELFFAFLTDWRILLPSFLLVPVFSMFLGSLMGKYGKKGLFWFYFLWMFCCFVLPRMFHAEPSEGVLDQVAFGLMRVVQLVPVSVWIGFGALTLITMAVMTIKLGMEQMV